MTEYERNKDRFTVNNALKKDLNRLGFFHSTSTANNIHAHRPIFKTKTFLDLKNEQLILEEFRWISERQKSEFWESCIISAFSAKIRDSFVF